MVNAYVCIRTHKIVHIQENYDQKMTYLQDIEFHASWII